MNYFYKEDITDFENWKEFIKTPEYTQAGNNKNGNNLFMNLPFEKDIIAQKEENGVVEIYVEEWLVPHLMGARKSNANKLKYFKKIKIKTAKKTTSKTLVAIKEYSNYLKKEFISYHTLNKTVWNDKFGNILKEENKRKDYTIYKDDYGRNEYPWYLTKEIIQNIESSKIGELGKFEISNEI